MSSNTTSRWGNLGPGILFAAIAVGASHLVQSTRAGATYGLALIFLILITYVAKYPAFRFGAQYASATGQSLLHGYLHQGRWAIAIYVIIALGTMFAALPAVTLVTAGLAQAAFGLQTDVLATSAIILIVSAVLLTVGGYRLLDRLVKYLMAVLVLATIVATILVIPEIDWSTASLMPSGNIEAADIFFMVALLGLMPSSVDISIWHSLWSVAKSRETGGPPSMQRALEDFHIGYIGAFLLALCFVMLGAGVMHGTATEFKSDAAGFAGQLIDLYVQSLGAWSGPMIGAIAVAVMFSTVLTGLDGYPRAAVSLVKIFAGKDDDVDEQESAKFDKAVYATAVVVLVLGSLIILYLFVTSLKIVVDVASTIIFLFAPIIAWLNHRVMTSKYIPANAQPSRGLRWLSLVGILWLSAFSGYFLFLRFIS